MVICKFLVLPRESAYNEKMQRVHAGFYMAGLFFLMAALSYACSAEQAETPPPLLATAVMPLETSGLTVPAPPAITTSELFMEADASGMEGSTAHAARSRYVTINLGILLDEMGTPLELGANHEITLNLFPDVVYTGVIERIERGGGVYSWAGHLKGVEFSQLTMVFTAGIFIGHFASPEGVYEVSSKGGDLYEIILIDQSKLPGGDEPLP
jgi:hypothetical protein